MNTCILSKDLQKNIDLISKNAPANFNLKTRELILKNNTKCMIIYIRGISKKERIEEYIITPLLFRLDCDIRTVSFPIEYISKRFIAIDDVELSSEIDHISQSLKKGRAILLIENSDQALICNTTESNFQKTSTPKIEETLKGEKSAFGENLNGNISLIQEKFKNDDLRIKKYVLGEVNHCEVALIYMENVIEPTVLNKLTSKLENIKESYIPDTGYLAQFIEKRPFSIFPQSKTTEKPNTVISDIIQGKAAIFVNGCAYAIVLPVIFIEFFQAFDDYSNKLISANFDRMLRLLGMIIILTASPIYLVLISYNVELIPLDLIKLVTISRKDIPLPPFLEIILMEMIIEFLREGGLRLPSLVGQTLSIVGGIILGESAVRAGIVSPATLVVVAVSVISTFLVPNYEMSLSIRLLRFYMLILGQLYGLFGVIIGLFSILAHLMSLESLGVPYFTPFAPMRFKDLKDSVVRYPLKYINNVPVSFKRRDSKK